MTSEMKWKTLFLALILTPWWLLVASPSLAQQGVYRDGAILDTIETPYGQIHKIHRARAASHQELGGLPSFDGDSFSFEHQIGALIDQIFRCFGPHMSGMGDNTVQFDGLSELLDPYLNGTQPLVFEFESVDGDSRDAFFNSFADGDLFPEGFEDPDTGTPLDAACVEIGIDDTLDSDIPAEVTSAMIEMSDSNGSVLPLTDITSFFSNPFDGRLSVVFGGLVGMNIDGLTLDIKMQQGADPNEIFADGFESGDATSWTDTVP